MDIEEIKATLIPIHAAFGVIAIAAGVFALNVKKDNGQHAKSGRLGNTAQKQPWICHRNPSAFWASTRLAIIDALSTTLRSSGRGYMVRQLVAP